MKIRPSHISRFLIVSAIALGVGSAYGQTAPASVVASPPPAPAPITTASGSDLKHAQRAGEQFGAFAGSRENTEALALALRNGSEVTLVGANGTSTTFTPATGHMGHGNVTKSMALAQRQLAAIGISNPTPQQVEAALNGGAVTVGSGADARTVEMQGILRLRADGMGWGNIAHTVGVKPGQGFKPMPAASTDGVMTAAGSSPLSHGSGRHGAHHVNGMKSAEVESGIHQHRGGRGVVTAAGGTQALRTETEVHRSGGLGTAHRHGGRAGGSGIVTATGAPAAGAQTLRGGETRIQHGGGAERVHGGGNRQVAAGSGVVTAAGGSASVALNSGSRSGGGNGGGHGGGKH